MTAVIATLAKRSNTLLATTQRAPRRMLAESDRELLPAGSGSETPLPGGSDVVVMRSQVSLTEAKSMQLPGPHICARTGRDSCKS